MFILLILIAAYLVLLIGVAWVSLHPPRTPIYLSPASLGAPQEDVQVEGLQAWWVPAEDAKVAVVLVHGYIMNRAELAPEAVALWQRGASCLLLDLRAHGRSPGKLCTLGVQERHDVAAASRWIRERQPGVPVILYGSSRGAAASVFAVAEDPTLADALILDSVYGRLSRAANGWWEFIGGKWLRLLLSPAFPLSDPFTGLRLRHADVAKSLESFKKPVLFLHGTADVLASRDEAGRNVAAAGNFGTVTWFEGMNHAEGRWNRVAEYRKSLFAFVDSVVGAE